MFFGLTCKSNDHTKTALSENEGIAKYDGLLSFLNWENYS